MAAAQIDNSRLALALRRRRLLLDLDRWTSEHRSGTQRDFAQFATEDTKGVAASDWDWLESRLDLAAFGVSAHTPLLVLRAPVQLHVGSALDLAGIADCIGLTPMTIRSCTRVGGTVGCWRLVENRTSFERVARGFGDRDAAVWLPGYPPEWWREGMGYLLDLLPAPAKVACDPDPAGIAIALQAAELWRSRGIEWRPWHMDADALDLLPSLRPLTEDDRALLQRLLQQDLPPDLRGLAQAMIERNAKGEQEALALID